MKKGHMKRRSIPSKWTKMVDDDDGKLTKRWRKPQGHGVSDVHDVRSSERKEKNKCWVIGAFVLLGVWKMWHFESTNQKEEKWHFGGGGSDF